MQIIFQVHQLRKRSNSLGDSLRDGCSVSAALLHSSVASKSNVVLQVSKQAGLVERDSESMLSSNLSAMSDVTM